MRYHNDEALLRRLMPTCAKCNKTVERMDTVVVDYFDRAFKVFCHGETETILIPPHIDVRTELKPGVAFTALRAIG